MYQIIPSMGSKTHIVILLHIWNSLEKLPIIQALTINITLKVITVTFQNKGFLCLWVGVNYYMIVAH